MARSSSKTTPTRTDSRGGRGRFQNNQTNGRTQPNRNRRSPPRRREDRADEAPTRFQARGSSRPDRVKPMEGGNGRNDKQDSRRDPSKPTYADVVQGRHPKRQRTQDVFESQLRGDETAPVNDERTDEPPRRERSREDRRGRSPERREGADGRRSRSRSRSQGRRHDGKHPSPPRRNTEGPQTAVEREQGQKRQQTSSNKRSRDEEQKVSNDGEPMANGQNGADRLPLAAEPSARNTVSGDRVTEPTHSNGKPNKDVPMQGSDGGANPLAADKLSMNAEDSQPATQDSTGKDWCGGCGQAVTATEKLRKCTASSCSKHLCVACERVNGGKCAKCSVSQWAEEEGIEDASSKKSGDRATGNRKMEDRSPHESPTKPSNKKPRATGIGTHIPPLHCRTIRAWRKKWQQAEWTIKDESDATKIRCDINRRIEEDFGLARALADEIEVPIEKTDTSVRSATKASIWMFVMKWEELERCEAELEELSSAPNSTTKRVPKPKMLFSPEKPSPADKEDAANKPEGRAREHDQHHGSKPRPTGLTDEQPSGTDGKRGEVDRREWEEMKKKLKALERERDNWKQKASRSQPPSTDRSQDSKTPNPDEDDSTPTKEMRATIDNSRRRLHAPPPKLKSSRDKSTQSKQKFNLQHLTQAELLDILGEPAPLDSASKTTVERHFEKQRTALRGIEPSWMGPARERVQKAYPSAEWKQREDRKMEKGKVLTPAKIKSIIAEVWEEAEKKCSERLSAKETERAKKDAGNKTTKSKKESKKKKSTEKAPPPERSSSSNSSADGASDRDIEPTGDNEPTGGDGHDDSTSHGSPPSASESEAEPTSGADEPRDTPKDAWLVVIVRGGESHRWTKSHSKLGCIQLPRPRDGESICAWATMNTKGSWFSDHKEMNQWDKIILWDTEDDKQRPTKQTIEGIDWKEKYSAGIKWTTARSFPHPGQHTIVGLVTDVVPVGCRDFKWKTWGAGQSTTSDQSSVTPKHTPATTKKKAPVQQRDGDGSTHAHSRSDESNREHRDDQQPERDRSRPIPPARGFTAIDVNQWCSSRPRVV